MDNLKDIKAIFFDLDNTLIATRKADKHACNKLNEILQTEYGLSSDDATTTCSSFLKKFRQCPDNPQYQLDDWRLHLFTTVLDHKHQHLANDIFQKWLQLRYKYLNLTPEIRSMLMKLKKHYLLALISNGPSNAQWEKIHKINLQSLFDLILISGDLPWEKPNKKIFHKAYTYLGVEPYQCAMCGDKIETDILGGLNANLGCTIWLPLSSSSSTSTTTTTTSTNNTTMFVDCTECSSDGRHRYFTPDVTIDKITDLSNLLFNSTNSTGSTLKLRSRMTMTMTTTASSSSDSNHMTTSRQTTHHHRLHKQHIDFSHIEVEDSNSNASDGS